MSKQLYVDKDMLNDRITKSGLMKGFICDNIGISRQAFDKKCKGTTPFRVSEVYVLCDLLKIVGEDKSKIFYPKG